jgi:hypothetical protein
MGVHDYAATRSDTWAEAADRLRGVVRWWVGGEEPGQHPHRLEGFSSLAERPRSERLRPHKTWTEAADRLRGVVRWWVGGEEPAQRTCVREQAPQTASRQRAADRS